MRNRHDEDLRLHCPGCSKRFETREGVQNHVRATLHGEWITDFSVPEDGEREKIVAWLKAEAGECKRLSAQAPYSDMAPIYCHRALYYEQAAGMISRGEHLKAHEPPTTEGEGE